MRRGPGPWPAVGGARWVGAEALFFVCGGSAGDTQGRGPLVSAGAREPGRALAGGGAGRAWRPRPGLWARAAPAPGAAAESRGLRTRIDASSQPHGWLGPTHEKGGWEPRHFQNAELEFRGNGCGPAAGSASSRSTLRTGVATALTFGWKLSIAAALPPPVGPGGCVLG